MNRVQGKVAFVTGAGRGQGRSHALRLAEEGADIIAIDICSDYETVGYGMSTPDDLKETARQVEALDRRIVFAEADVRDAANAGIKGLPFLAPYVAAKHGVVGISRSLANELAKHSIRVNTVHPTGVDTPMVEGLGGLDPLLQRDQLLGPIFMNSLPIEMVDARDISNAVLFLASDESRYVTGLELTIDAGNTIR